MVTVSLPAAHAAVEAKPLMRIAALSALIFTVFIIFP
jgi:hypothetical protein